MTRVMWNLVIILAVALIGIPFVMWKIISGLVEGFR